jgi:conjugative relaxase-like TrwC/TraI family protein
MLSIAQPIKGAACIEYYLNMAREDYYLRTSEGDGRWFGSAKETLGLGDKPAKDEFHWLLLGYTPNGSQELVQNAGMPSRASGWDLTFSAPKGVSVLWGLAPDPVRREIEQAQQQAVEFALRKLEEGFLTTRRGKEGKTEEPAATVFALFEHGSSRDQDPQLHTHAVLLNLGVRQDGTTGSLHTIGMFRAKIALGAIYQAQLAAELQRRLRLEVALDRVGFQIKGIPAELCRDFSQRRLAIEEHLRKRGLSGAVAAKIAALETRPAKVDVPRDQLFARWRQVAKSRGWSAEKFLKSIANNSSRTPSMDLLAAELRHKLETAPADHLTPSRCVLWAMKAAIRHGADGEVGLRALEDAVRHARPRLRVEWHRLFNSTPWAPPRQRLIALEWKKPFSKGWWGPARSLELPTIAIELPKLTFGEPKPFPARWHRIRRRVNLLLGEFRTQDRVLFPKAPKWSPLHGVSFPAFRFCLGKSELPPLKQWTVNQDQRHSR